MRIDRFTLKAQEAIQEARELASGSGHPEIGPFHLLGALVEHGRIQTTETKARELRRVAERAISRATALGDILLKAPEELTTEERARYVHEVRMVRRVLRALQNMQIRMTRAGLRVPTGTEKQVELPRGRGRPLPAA